MKYNVFDAILFSILVIALRCFVICGTAHALKTSAHVECSPRNEIFTLRCGSAEVAVAALLPSLLLSPSLLRSTSLLSLSLSFSRALAFSLRSGTAFLFRIREIITKLIINCRAMQFERIAGSAATATPTEAVAVAATAAATC